jgi:catechol 2,3-dioxygenase-like lactoylglutathione lyase family enzyme
MAVRPKTMKIAAIHHAQITIPSGSEAEARAFYCDVLGLSEIEKPDSLKRRGGFWLQVGNVQMHVGLQDSIERHAMKAHLAYQVDDIAAWRVRLIKAGFPPEDSIPIPGYDRFECRDPFGNRLEFIQPL